MTLLARLAQIEARFDLWRQRRRGTTTAVIDPYVGYATPDHLVLRGRVLERLQGRVVKEGQGRWANLRGMASLFATDELAGVSVSVLGRQCTTDGEGFFEALLPRGEAHGWITLPATVGETTAELPVMIPNPDAQFGVISDIDDTMMLTGAWSLPRNLWTTFTGNAGTRLVFEDAAHLMVRLSQGDLNPVFYVSSSPWNLHGFLVEIFDKAGLPRGPMYLRDLGLNETSLLGGGHHGHKGAKIDLILAANPKLSFILIGDTGQKDAAVYAAAVARHPGRIKRIILRTARRAASVADVETIRSAGVPLDLVDHYEAVEGL